MRFCNTPGTRQKMQDFMKLKDHIQPMIRLGNAVRMDTAGQHGVDRSRFAFDIVIGGLFGKYVCAGGLKSNIHCVDRTGTECIANGKSGTVRSLPLGALHIICTVGGGSCCSSNIPDGLGNGQILYLDAGQRRDYSFASCLHSMAVCALLMLLAICVGGCGGYCHPLPVVVGGFGVVCGFSGLLALRAGTAMSSVINLRPCGEVVGFHLEIVASCAGLDMRTGVHVHPRLRIGIVGMADRYGAGSGFGAAGGCDNCRALCLGSYLAGSINLRDCGLVARPSQAARCVDRLLHGGELITQ